MTLFLPQPNSDTRFSLPRELLGTISIRLFFSDQSSKFLKVPIYASFQPKLFEKSSKRDQTVTIKIYHVGKKFCDAS